MIADAHPRQTERLAALHALDILDTPREAEFDDVVDFLSKFCGVPVAVVNLIDADRQWFKAEVGLGVRSTPLDTSLCSHVILERDFIEIPDTLADPRMADNPLCTGDGGFRFYAGALLTTEDDLPIGTLCVLDKQPRVLTDLQRQAIRVLGRRVMREIEHRKALREQAMLRKEIDHRVKNSLSMVGAILHLQGQRSGSGEVRAALDAVRGRLGAIEAFHEELHQDGETRTIDLDALVRRVVAKLAPVLPDTLSVAIDVPAIAVASEQANALALIINEFATNSAKHGFAPGHAGTVRIAAHVHDRRLTMTLADDGTADAAALGALSGRGGLGVKVIDQLARSHGGVALWSLGAPGLVLTFELAL